MNLRRLRAADWAVIASLLVLMTAAAAPALRGRAFRGLVDSAVGQVEALRTRAVDTRTAGGAWPTASEPGVTPPELRGAYAGDSALAFPGYTLEWRTVDVVERVASPTPPPPPTIMGDAPPDSVGPEMISVVRPLGAIVLHSPNRSLLAEMLDRLGAELSFVRDTTWTLVIDERRGGSSP